MQKVVVDRNNRQLYPLGRQPFMLVSFTVIGNAYDRIFDRQPFCVVQDQSTAQVEKVACTENPKDQLN